MRREELAELVEPLLEEDGFELVECSVSQSRRIGTYRIAVDCSGGVPVEACSRLSRKIAVLLDANPMLRGAYNLEVSSAGMSRRIWKAEHFVRFRGEDVRIEYCGSDGATQRIQGSIGELEGESVRIILHDGEERLLPLATVVKAFLHMDPWKKRPGRRHADGGPERESALEDA